MTIFQSLGTWGFSWNSLWEGDWVNHYRSALAQGCRLFLHPMALQVDLAGTFQECRTRRRRTGGPGASSKFTQNTQYRSWLWLSSFVRVCTTSQLRSELTFIAPVCIMLSWVTNTSKFDWRDNTFSGIQNRPSPPPERILATPRKSPLPKSAQHCRNALVL